MKRVRVKNIVIIALIVTFVLYVGGGVAAHLVVSNVVFSNPGKSIEQLNEPESLVQKRAMDFEDYQSRETLTIEKEDRKLAVYHYANSPKKGNVLAVHGMRSNSDDANSIYQHYLYQKGYDVFALDLSGCGRSTGEVTGLHQAAYDVKDAIDGLKELNYLEETNPLILIGHSWGAYGIAASLNLGVRCDYLITMSAFLTPEKIMMQYARNKVGVLADITAPSFLLTMNLRYGSSFHLNSSAAIEEGVRSKALIIHGEKDTSVPLNDSSLYQNIQETGKTKKLLLPEIGHNTPWLSKDAIDYASEMVELVKKGGDTSTSLITLDLERSSALNPTFVDAVDTLLG